MSKLHKCKACITLGADHVPPDGSPLSDVMFISQSPGAQEVTEQLPFIGPCGEALGFLLDEAGLDRAQVYITNALKCHPPGNRAGHIEELRMCKKLWLNQELKVIQPKLIVLLGKDAWETVTKKNIPFEHGKMSKTKKRAYLTVFHPGYFLRKGNIEEFVKVGNTIREFLDAS